MYSSLNEEAMDLYPGNVLQPSTRVSPGHVKGAESPHGGQPLPNKGPAAASCPDLGLSALG